MSWTRPDGKIQLMGGFGNNLEVTQETTEIVTVGDIDSQPSYPLKDPIL